jgi:tetratricopeptide (TPR) repeat protein
LGRTFDALGQYDQAIAAYRKALAIDTVVYGKNHSEVAICYNNIGMAWKAKGDYKKAEASLHRAIESAKAFWPETHPSMKTLRRNLAEIIPVEKK